MCFICIVCFAISSSLYPFVGALGRLCFVSVVFPGHLYLYFYYFSAANLDIVSFFVFFSGFFLSEDLM